MNYNELIGIMPDDVISQLPSLGAFGVDGPMRLSHLLGQCAHESALFKAKEENLNYSAEGLLNTFSKYFNATDAASYARKPERIANRVYANRMGNGAEESGEGYKYRGRGYLQTTGKSNYKELSDFLKIDVVANPDLVSSAYPLISAAFYFEKKGMWIICDKGVTDDVITEITKKVNGGTHGLAERIEHTKRIYNALT